MNGWVDGWMGGCNDLTMLLHMIAKPVSRTGRDLVKVLRQDCSGQTRLALHIPHHEPESIDVTVDILTIVVIGVVYSPRGISTEHEPESVDTSYLPFFPSK